MGLSCNFKRKADDFVNGLKDIYGDALVSVVLYGSAASGEYVCRNSNINMAVVLKDASIPSIKKAARLARRLKFALINPVFFGEDHIKTSLDVFPIEFLDIKENHELLYGRDLFGNITVDPKNLRFQCEQELKSKILNIKKVYLKTRDRAVLKDALFKTLTSSLHILRNLVRLKGKIPPYKKELVVEEIGKEFFVDVGSFKRILEAKTGNVRLSGAEIDGLFSGFVATLEAISDKVDRF